MTRELWKWSRTWGAWCCWWATVLLLSGAARAQEPSTRPDNRLVEGTTPDELRTTRQMLCGSRFCLWALSEALSPCVAEPCYSDSLRVTDLEGKPLGAFSEDSDLTWGAARFLGPRQVEFVALTSLVVDRSEDPEAWRRELGFGAMLMQRRLMTLSQHGSKITSDTREWLSPKHHALLERRLNSQRTSAKPKLEGSIPETVLAKARKVCGSEGNQALKPTLFECHGGGVCVLVLASTSEDPARSSCALRVKNDDVEHLPPRLLMGEEEQPYVFSLEATRYCFTCLHCGPRGSRGDAKCISRERPDRMAFVETAGLHVDHGSSYPVQQASSAPAGAAAALTVHANTMGHVQAGLDHWRDAKDLSLKWQAMRLGEDLRLHVEVEDDLFHPAGDGPAVQADHLELEFRGKLEQLNLGVVLAAHGQVRFRRWMRGEAGLEREVDEEYAAVGTWKKTARGYRVEVSLPLAPLREALGDWKTWLFAILASDADGKKRQETLLRSGGSLVFWDEYPPTIEEYNRVRAGN